MSDQDKINIANRVERFFKKNGYKYITPSAPSVKEHEWCYEITWFSKEFLKKPSKTYMYNMELGVILVSKISDLIEFVNIFYNVDYVTPFELKVQNLEAYWELTIDYDRKYVSILKTLLECNTSSLLKMINQEKKIIKHELEKNDLVWLQKSLDQYNIPNKFIQKIRHRTALS